MTMSDLNSFFFSIPHGNIVRLRIEFILVVCESNQCRLGISRTCCEEDDDDDDDCRCSCCPTKKPYTPPLKQAKFLRALVVPNQ